MEVRLPPLRVSMPSVILAIAALLAQPAVGSTDQNRWWEDTKFQDEYCALLASSTAQAADAAHSNGMSYDVYAGKMKSHALVDSTEMFILAFKIWAKFEGSEREKEGTEESIRGGCIDKQRLNTPPTQILPDSYKNPACPLFIQQQLMADLHGQSARALYAVGSGESARILQERREAIQQNADLNLASCNKAPGNSAANVAK